MTATAITSALGLTAAAIWGVADFCGGMAARRLRVFWVLAISHGFSLACLLLLAVLLHQAQPGIYILGWGLFGGVAGGVALLAFYHALSLGELGITAALSGLLAAGVPVLFTVTTIGAPSRRQLAGFIVAAGAIWLISSQPGGNKAANIQAVRQRRKKLALAVVSGIGFGIFFVALRQANSGGLIWPLAAARVGSLTLALCGGLVFSRNRLTVEAPSKPELEPRLPRSRNLWKTGVALAILAGTCDTSGNFFFIAATRTGRLDVAAVLSSLYPASTILLAAWILKERTSPRQGLGMAAALAAVALIS